MSKNKKSNRVVKKAEHRQLQYQEARNNMKRAFSRNQYFWLAGLCGLYFLKYYNPAFAWFGALGALGFYKNSNKSFRKLTYISILAILGVLGIFI